MKSDSEDAERELREQVARFSAFVRRTLRFWPSVPIALAVGGLACVGFLLWNKPEYRSETVVLYAQGPATGEAADSGAARNVTVRLKELLMSRPKLERVISEFNLYSDVRKEHGMAEAVEELEKHVEYRAPGGDTFSVAFIGTSPVETQRVTARLAALVIEQDSELRRNQARGTRDFLVTEKAKAEATLRSAERDLAAFMAEHPRFALDVTPLATGAAIRATTAPSIASPGALTSRVFSPPPSTPSGASSPRPAAPVAFAADSEVARATAAVAAARTHLAEQLEHYTEAHPDVRSASSAVERAESRLAALTGASVAPSPATAPAPAEGAPAASGDRPTPSARRVPSVPLRVARPVAPAEPSGDVVALETEWLKLTRAATQARQRLDQVEAAFFKADILASSQSGAGGLQMTVIDPAYLPARPLPPGRTLIVAIFVAGALLIGVFVAMLRAILDDRIFEASDALGPAELLVVVPRARSPRRVHVPG
jgi:capsular polysaccharide biosynthesis protein